MIKEMPSNIDYELINSNIFNYVYQIQKCCISKANEEYLIGIQMTSKYYIAYFNNQPYHTAPLALTMAHNAVFQ